MADENRARSWVIDARSPVPDWLEPSISSERRSMLIDTGGSCHLRANIGDEVVEVPGFAPKLIRGSQHRRRA